MPSRILILPLFIALTTIGCKKPELPPAIAGTDASPALPIAQRGTDLSKYGVPGIIDLPAGYEISSPDKSCIGIGRDDDPFDLRINPRGEIEGKIPEHIKRLKAEKYEFIAEEVDGYAAWLRDENGKVHIAVNRFITLGGKPFMVGCLIFDERADKRLAEKVWAVAKSVRAK